MKISLTPALRKAVAFELTKAQQENAILDVYGTATKIQAEYPNENVAWEDIVQALLSGRGDIRAIEFAERGPEIVEIILPGSSEDAAMDAAEEIAAAKN